MILSHGRSPRGKTYPIGASGAIISDLMDIGETETDEREFLCNFLAKDKRMIVFELKSKKVIVELQMTTKLNFWRFLPPVVHGGNLVFLLITPVGGFHWLPLAKSPRPRQVWKRGAELQVSVICQVMKTLMWISFFSQQVFYHQNKKIVSYEEGGSNGLDGKDCLSSVALVLTCTSTVGDPVEAWCLTVHNESKPLCVSSDVLGAALFCTSSMFSSSQAFNPLLVLATEKTNGIIVELYKLSNDPLCIENINAGEIWDFNRGDAVHEAPTMAMGTSPAVFCLCWNKLVAIVVRDRGLMACYEFNGNALSLIFKHNFKHYVVDAGLQSNEMGDGIQVVVLVCEEGCKDGRIVTVKLES